MALTAGTLSIVSVGSTTASLSSTAATGGTGPYTEAWYASQTTGFSPGPANQVAGASGLSAMLTGLPPGVPTYVVVVYTDTGNGNATVNSAQLTINTIPAQSPNQFQQAQILGMVDQRFNYNTQPVIIDLSQSGSLLPGQAVKFASTLGGDPRVVGCTADSDVVFGFINYDIKSQAFNPGDKCEISKAGNVMYLVSTGAIARGSQVTLDLTYPGGVAQKVTSSGNQIVGYALDGCAASGALIRVQLSTPSFSVA